MATITRRRLAAGGLATTALLCGVLALTSTSASAGSSPTPPGVTSGGGAFDLEGNPVEARTYVGNDQPSDLGELECSATMSVDGTVTDQQGDCGGLQAAP